MKRTRRTLHAGSLLAVLMVAALLAGCENPGDPFGVLDEVRADGSSVRLLGWVLDTSDPTETVEVHVYVDGRGHGAFRADAHRPDVEGVWGGVFEDMGPRHGVDVTIDVAENGTHDVCLYGINIGAGRANTLIGCQRVTTFGLSPIGTLDRLIENPTAGTTRLVGWSKDPESSAPIEVQVTADGAVVGTYRADRPRPDVQAAIPGAGPAHGFDITIPIGNYLDGTRLCVYGVNVGRSGGNPLLGCELRPVVTTTVNGIVVAASIGDDLRGLIDLAATRGLALSGTGFRTSEQQIALRRQNCGTSQYAIYEAPASACSPPTARPGTSMHERGLAIDFRCNGAGMGSTSSPCYPFLVANAATFGLYNLPGEPWHWSVNGQ